MMIDKNALAEALQRLEPNRHGAAYVGDGGGTMKRYDMSLCMGAAYKHLAILNAVDAGEVALVPTNSSPDMMLSGLKAFVADVQERLGKHKKNDEKLDHDELLQLQGFRMGAVTHNTWEIRAAWYAMLRAAGRHPLLGGE